MVYRLRALVLRLLRVPLLYKILVANCVATALLSLAGAVVAIQHMRALPTDAHYDLMVLFLVVGIGVSFALNLLVLRLVLAPLNRLEAALDSIVQQRQPPPISSVVSDKQFDRLATATRNVRAALDEKNQRVQLLSEQVLCAQAVERQRIARELHDEAAQTLTAILLYLKLLEKSSTSEENQRLQNLRKLIAHALSDIRQLAVELNPKILNDWGLEAALAQRVDELNVDGSRMVTLQVVGGTPERLPKDLEITFYHVAQEALNNMAQHSHAHRAQVLLNREADCLTLEVEDDGVGFSPNAMKAGSARGFGLVSMRQRLDLVGGELTIESSPGCGTRVSARAPRSTLPSAIDLPADAPR